jgi:glutamate-1-semialdehyde 2,1-aminomutase
LAAARRFTGKRKVVVFGGGYHGAVLSFVGGKPAVNNVDLDDWIVARYNDVESARRAIRTEGVAAVLLEGMQGSAGAICATSEFMHAVQEVAKECGVLFVLDEVMTSRLAPSGVAGLMDLNPDLKTFGKYLGAGLAFGAFGGRHDIMSVFDPRIANALTHSGTFNNNTLAMNAGYIAMSQIFTPDVCAAFTSLGDWLLRTLGEVTNGTKCCFTGKGTILTVHFTDTGVQTIARAEDVEERWDLKDVFWMEMMEDGFLLQRRGTIALILETPKEELERFVDCTKAFLRRHGEVMRVMV